LYFVETPVSPIDRISYRLVARNVFYVEPENWYFHRPCMIKSAVVNVSFFPFISKYLTFYIVLIDSPFKVVRKYYYTENALNDEGSTHAPSKIRVPRRKFVFISIGIISTMQ